MNLNKWSTEEEIKMAVEHINMYLHKHFTLMAIVALFTIWQVMEIAQCPSPKGQIKKIWYIHIMEYYSAIQRE